MKTIIILAAFLSALAAYAEEPVKSLGDMKKEIVDQKVKEAENVPQTANIPDNYTTDKSEKRVTVNISRKDCLDQGNTLTDCELLGSNEKNTLSPYDFNKIRIPSMNEAKDDVFISIQIKN